MPHVLAAQHAVAGDSAFALRAPAKRLNRHVGRLPVASMLLTPVKMDATSKADFNRRVFRLAILALGEATWLFLGYILILAWSHILWFFPVALWAWLMCGYLSVAAITARRKLIGVVLAGFLATGSCLPATMVYFTYSQSVAEAALNELIEAGENRSIPHWFDIDARSSLDLFENASNKYTVIFGDSMFQSYEWKVRFANGSEHSIYMGRTSMTEWQVYAACIVSCRPEAP